VTYGPINIRKNDGLETYNALFPLKPERGQEILKLSEIHLYKKARKYGVKIILGQSAPPKLNSLHKADRTERFEGL